MVRMMLCAAVVASLAFASSSQAADSECLGEGDPIGAFYVTKVAGADSDGVEKGQELCYRCRYGSRPMVMVFARKNSDKLNELVGQLNQAVGSHSDAQLKGFVTLMGQDAGSLKKAAEKIASSAKVDNVPVVIAKDLKSGPQNYKLDPSAEVTIVVANNSRVVANHMFSADEIDVAAVMKSVESSL